MPTFETSLENALIKNGTQLFWLLQLYYGDESNFTGFTTIPMIYDSVNYYGAFEFGGIESEVIFELNKSIVNEKQIEIKIPNTERLIGGKRFSDLLDENNYVNRKWKIYQCDGNAVDGESLIASGLIAPILKNDDTEIIVKLDGWWKKFNIDFPVNLITKEDYPNVPDINLNEPVTRKFGSLSEVNSSYGKRYLKGYSPALVIGADIDAGVSGVEVLISENETKQYGEIITKSKGKNILIDCTDYNSNKTTAIAWVLEPLEENCVYFERSEKLEEASIKVSGGTVEDYEKAINDDVDDNLTWNIASGTGKLYFECNPELAVKFGGEIDYFRIYAVGSVTGGYDVIRIRRGTTRTSGGALIFTADKAITNKYIEGIYTSQELEDWDIARDNIIIEVENANNLELKIYKIELQVYYREMNVLTEQVESKKLKLLYSGGVGEIYKSWIDAGSRNNGYNAGDVLENPVYVIEEIIRSVESKLELTEGSLINIASFDEVGNTTNGTIGDVFDMDVVDIKYEETFYKINKTQNIIEEICNQYGLIFWWDENEKANVRARKRTYSGVDHTIKFSNISKINIEKTEFEKVVNDLKVRYKRDYTIEKLIKVRTSEDNVNLKSTSSQTKYDQTIEKSIDVSTTFDKDTADGIGEAKVGWFNEQDDVLTIEMVNAKHNDMEKFETFNIDEFPENYKVNGEEITTADKFLILGKKLFEDGAIFKAILV